MGFDENSQRFQSFTSRQWQVLLALQLPDWTASPRCLCMDHPGNLTAWFPAWVLRRRESRTRNYRVFAGWLNQCTVCSATGMQHTRLTPGPEAQILVTEPQSELQRLPAAPHSSTTFHTWGDVGPEKGSTLPEATQHSFNQILSAYRGKQCIWDWELRVKKQPQASVPWREEKGLT